MPEAFFCFTISMLAIVIGIPAYGFVLLNKILKQQEESFTGLRREIRELKQQWETQQKTTGFHEKSEPVRHASHGIAKSPPRVSDFNSSDFTLQSTGYTEG